MSSDKRRSERARLSRATPRRSSSPVQRTPPHPASIPSDAPARFPPALAAHAHRKSAPSGEERSTLLPSTLSSSTPLAPPLVARVQSDVQRAT
ncbi:hypothetical protein L210DRAFT_3646865 [Boletus edulis BED1]|uniref:Uncharacterized protein n=1 Tax=Boletus edulis BED1 TaxID=1328754 RepID=A0AAD4GDM1_BOLED|nr:hypothetical protein L210DRAFT_3646865 [Boletus edulis BED1]